MYLAQYLVPSKCSATPDYKNIEKGVNVNLSKRLSLDLDFDTIHIDSFIPILLALFRHPCHVWPILELSFHCTFISVITLSFMCIQWHYIDLSICAEAMLMTKSLSYVSEYIVYES